MSLKRQLNGTDTVFRVGLAERNTVSVPNGTNFRTTYYIARCYEFICSDKKNLCISILLHILYYF